MKLTQLLLASTFTIAAATTFAASADKQPQEKVIVSTQEQPDTVSSESAAAKPTSAQPASEVAVEEAPAKPAQ